MPMTVGQVLATSAVQDGHPLLLTAHDRLDRPVRWVHVAEVPDVAALVSGGEVILTTLLTLPDDPARQRRYVRDLAAAGVSALVVELGRRFAKVPDVMVAEAEAAGLPVVALRKVVKFVAVTEAVHARIVDEQHDLLTFSRAVHETFTEIGVEGADVQEILERTAAMAGTAVVLEDLAHRVVAHALAGAGATHVLAGWSARSRLVPGAPGTTAAPGEGWLLAPVGSRRGSWGRLVLVGPPAVPADAARMLIERAAQALAVARLMERDVDAVRGRALGRFLADLLRARSADEEDLRAAAQVLGLADARRYLAVCLAPATPELGGEAGPGAGRGDILERQRRVHVLAEAAGRAAAAAGLSVLVAPLEDGIVGAVLALPPRGTEAAALERLAAALRAPAAGAPGHVMAAARERTSLAQAGADLAEAAHVARAAAVMPGPRRDCYRITDIRLRGLLMQLAGDERVTAFAERELHPLLVFDDRHGMGLVALLRGYLEAGGNIAALARTTGLSRQTLYARLRTVGRVLGADLDDAETRLSLHTALLVRQLGAPGA